MRNGYEHVCITFSISEAQSEAGVKRLKRLNFQISHKFILVATGGGAILAGSYNDTAVTSDFSVILVCG